MAVSFEPVLIEVDFVEPNPVGVLRVLDKVEAGTPGLVSNGSLCVQLALLDETVSELSLTSIEAINAYMASPRSGHFQSLSEGQMLAPPLTATPGPSSRQSLVASLHFRKWGAWVWASKAAASVYTS